MTPFPTIQPDIPALSREAKSTYRNRATRTPFDAPGAQELVDAGLGFISSPGTDYSYLHLVSYASEFSRLELPPTKSGYACLVQTSEDFEEKYALAVTGGIYCTEDESRRGFRQARTPMLKFEARSEKRDCDSDRVYMVNFRVEYPMIHQVAREGTIIEGVLREPMWYVGTNEPAESGSDLYKFTPPQHDRIDGVHCRVTLSDTLYELGHN